jgi:hypothetical protein
MDDDRNSLEHIAKSLAYCEHIGAEMFSRGIAVRPDLCEISAAMIALREKLHTWLLDRPRPPARNIQQYWPAFCPVCGWAGLSCECEGGQPIADTGDYDDVRCPVCACEVDDDIRAT